MNQARVIRLEGTHRQPVCDFVETWMAKKLFNSLDNNIKLFDYELEYR